VDPRASSYFRNYIHRDGQKAMQDYYLVQVVKCIKFLKELDAHRSLVPLPTSHHPQGRYKQWGPRTQDQGTHGHPESLYTLQLVLGTSASSLATNPRHDALHNV